MSRMPFLNAPWSASRIHKSDRGERVAARHAFGQLSHRPWRTLPRAFYFRGCNMNVELAPVKKSGAQGSIARSMRATPTVTSSRCPPTRRRCWSLTRTEALTAAWWSPRKQAAPSNWAARTCSRGLGWSMSTTIVFQRSRRDVRRHGKLVRIYVSHDGLFCDGFAQRTGCADVANSGAHEMQHQHQPVIGRRHGAFVARMNTTRPEVRVNHSDRIQDAEWSSPNPCGALSRCSLLDLRDIAALDIHIYGRGTCFRTPA